jgi:hypothetical protein
VRLKGTSLEQIVTFLHRIETSSSHLIVRSLKIARAAATGRADVSFSVRTERA